MRGIVTMYPIKAIVLAIVINCVSSRPDGAPPVSCATMQPEHIIPRFNTLAETQSTPSPYKFTAKWDKNMKMVRVSVDGDGNNQIQGFLIQGRLGIYQPAIGSFINIENPNGDGNAKYQNCALLSEFHTNASITHSNRERQDNLEFYWKPPTNDSITGNVTFYATIARDKNTYWVKEKSNSVPLKMDDADGDDETESSSNENAPIHVLFLSILVLYSCLKNTF